MPLEFSGLNRIPILLLGPLLHRAHEAFVPLVGGDRIGRRPVDFHVSALQQMGAEVEVQPQGITARMAGRLRGTRITLPYPSVGATETVLLSAVLAEGRTVIHNAATEPEVVELALFLQRMGAQIALRPDRRFVIEGVESLNGATATLQGDRLEAFSYLVAGLMTGGEVRVGGCNQDRMVTAINTLQQMGATLEINDEWISASATSLQPSAVQTDTHPGFMTDWQPPLIVLMTQADGMSVLHETVYEDRLGYVDAVKAMGGEIELFTTCLGGPACRFHDSSAVHSAVVRGVSKLQGAEVTIPDVRAGLLVGDRGRGGGGAVDPARHPPPRAGLQRPLRHARVAGPPPPPPLSAQRRLTSGGEPSAQTAATSPTAAKSEAAAHGACSRSPSCRASGGRTSASTLPTAMAAPSASTR